MRPPPVYCEIWSIGRRYALRLVAAAPPGTPSPSESPLAIADKATPPDAGPPAFGVPGPAAGLAPGAATTGPGAAAPVPGPATGPGAAAPAEEGADAAGGVGTDAAAVGRKKGLRDMEAASSNQTTRGDGEDKDKHEKRVGVYALRGAQDKPKRAPMRPPDTPVEIWA
eukprot:9433638-Pyramimonas_sp.AAC.1